LPSNRENGKTAVTVLSSANYLDYKDLTKDEYLTKKDKESKKILDKLSKMYDFGNIELVDSATPRTKQHYSNGFEGSLYGILCSAKQKSLSILMPKTRFNNLYLIGESIIAPGLIGVFLSVDILMHYFDKNLTQES